MGVVQTCLRMNGCIRRVPPPKADKEWWDGQEPGLLRDEYTRLSSLEQLRFDISLHLGELLIHAINLSWSLGHGLMYSTGYRHMKRRGGHKGRGACSKTWSIAGRLARHI